MFRGEGVFGLETEMEKVGLFGKKRVVDLFYGQGHDHISIRGLTRDTAMEQADLIFHQQIFGRESSTVLVRDDTKKGKPPLVILFPQALGFSLDHAKMPWIQTETSIFGRVHKTPRLVQWYASSPDFTYGWKGHPRLVPRPMKEIGPIHTHVENLLQAKFDGCLANLYRTGDDCVGWHSDDEPELTGEIASVSFGAARDFVLRRKDDHHQKVSVKLNHGDLLWMHPSIQEDWQHSIPRRKREREARINLTFRRQRVK